MFRSRNGVAFTTLAEEDLVPTRLSRMSLIRNKVDHGMRTACSLARDDMMIYAVVGHWSGYALAATSAALTEPEKLSFFNAIDVCSLQVIVFHG
jgi:hypothetical protein